MKVTKRRLWLIVLAISALSSVLNFCIFRYVPPPDSLEFSLFMTIWIAVWSLLTGWLVLIHGFKEEPASS